MSKEEAVGDVSYAIDVAAMGTVEVYESVNKNGRYYIAPQLRFSLLDPPQVARLSQLEAEGTKECQFSLVMLAPNVREAVASSSGALKGESVKIGNVGNLRVYALIVDLDNAQVKKKYDVRSYTIISPAYSQVLDVDLIIGADKAQEFVKAVNDGDVTFKLSYVYKPINLDNRIEKLDLKIVRESKALRDLDQQGKELISAKQMAEAATDISREITSTVIEGLGTIEPASLPISKLMDIFAVGETWKKDDAEIKAIDDRINKQFNLNINPAEFQPFRVQKHVIETLNQDTDTAMQRQKYAS